MSDGRPNTLTQYVHSLRIFGVLDDFAQVLIRRVTSLISENPAALSEARSRFRTRWTARRGA